MGRVTFVQFDGTEHSVEIEDGESLMRAAVSNGIAGIDADCGGSCACATCHVHVGPQWLAAVGPPASEMENELLQLAPDVQPDSRLSCQVAMKKELDGVVVYLPESQH